ncbi:MAG: tRNA (adenosine(37)-N6)-threonylcarbamoyltransferase complex ATPase subunit type 1 TsaE [Caldiserica bacterium]|jgi:tRNA threonylcarbamoyladenosine biosynthesis protein TsaE|nr:tRNA (adenosine(37)-N6)-threonylcarbamoyltransferase complex ATPase subunit type 1 TsaE [Caldisericota bacterium]MDH7562310.1 tRNA (adenosine(37)-N6)-threonylcarbamoyltransferase complex ATPase subunit type 1 TsaE [Caldisericota bacterium]
MRTIISRSPEETRRIAREMGRKLKQGNVVALFGKLGAGKTVFVQGLAEGLGIPPNWAKSPSFTLIRVFAGIIPFYHLDLYRLEDPLSEDLDWQEIFEMGISAVEWAEKIEEILPPGTTKVRLKVKGKRIREIEIENDPCFGN